MTEDHPSEGIPADPCSETAYAHLLPPIGECWSRDMRTFRTVGKHRFNKWGRCWHVQFCAAKEGEIGVREVSITQWNRWAHNAKPVCRKCMVVCGSEYFSDSKGAKTVCDACKRKIKHDWREAAYEAARNEGIE